MLESNAGREAGGIGMSSRLQVLDADDRRGLVLALRSHGVLPNATQLALFQTVVASDADFAACWDRWTTQLSPPFSVDPISLQSLPLLYKRLQPGHADLLSKLIQDSYRTTWLRNHLIFRALQTSLETLHQAGVRTLVLKGAALINAYYKDMGARTMGDFDILVPKSQFLIAAQSLEASGWTPLYSASDFDTHFDHALTFADGRGNFLDLHVHVLHFTTRPDADDLFWANSVPVSLAGVETQALSAADQILNLAEHGMSWVPNPPLRWIPDIAWVISRGNPDWDRLLWMARHLHKSLVVSTALEYLNENHLAEAPEWVLAALRDLPVDGWERSDFELNARDSLGSLVLAARAHWHRLNQEKYGRSLYRRLQLLPAYITFCAKRAGYKSRMEYLFDFRIIKRHLLAKQGLYERPVIDPRLRS
jgi:Uncharacterised nucleotidyltransferase